MHKRHLPILGLSLTLALLTACQNTPAATPLPANPAPITQPVGQAGSLMRLDFQNLNGNQAAAQAQVLGARLGSQGLTDVPTTLAARVLSVNTFTYSTKRHVRTTVEFTYNGATPVTGPVLLPIDTSSADPAKDTIGTSPFINVLYFDKSDARQKVLDNKLRLTRGKTFDAASQMATDDLDATPLLAQDLTGFTAPTFDGVDTVAPYNASGYQVAGLPNNTLNPGDKFTVTIGLDVDDVGTPATDPFYASMFYVLAAGAPAVQEAQGIDRIIGVSGDLNSLELNTTDMGGADLLIQNKTGSPVTVSIPAPATGLGQLKVNVGSVLDTYTETIPANATATIPYMAECPTTADTYTQDFDIRVGTQVKKTSITVVCTTDADTETEALDTTKVLTPQDENQLLAYDEEEMTATFIAGSSFASTLLEGDVVVSDPIPNIAPEGLAFKIETISADKTTVTFSPADLGEMFEEADVNNEVTPNFEDIDLKSSTFMPGITASAGTGDTLLNLSFDQVLIGDKIKKDPQNYLVANGKLVVNKPKLVFKAQLNAPVVGSFNVDEALTIGGLNDGMTVLSDEQMEALFFRSGLNKIRNAAKKGFNSVTKLVDNSARQVVSLGKGAISAVKNLSQGVSFNSELYGQFTEQASLRIEGKANSKITKKIMIGNVKFKPISLMLGPIPVTVTHELNIYIDLNGEVSGEVLYNVEQSFDYKAGISYDSRRSPKVQKINEVKSTFTQEFQLYGNFDLDAKAVAEYEAKLFGTFGAFANAKIGPKVSARAQGGVLNLNGEICASGDAGTREFEFKIPVVNTPIKLDGTNINLFGTCFAKQNRSVALPLSANMEYRVDGETKTTTGITFDTVAEVDYGPAVPFKLNVENPKDNQTYLYQWKLDSQANETGDAERKIKFTASEIGKEHTLTGMVSVGTDPDNTLQKATKKLTFKLKNSAPVIEFTTADQVEGYVGNELTVAANFKDNNQEINCGTVRWSSDSPSYTITGQGVENGGCFVKLKFNQAGNHKIYAQVTDEVGVTTSAFRTSNIVLD
ncbi:hypothetical protein [Deinococcus sp.]|uniref:hypothetical protein n=1 Tax=Deinococcus sp. TaxID=47478 RepID=UPI00391A608F